MLVTFPKITILHKIKNCTECNTILEEQTYTLTIGHQGHFLCKKCAKILCEEIGILSTFIKKEEEKINE
jgi:hypothetical protein